VRCLRTFSSSCRSTYLLYMFVHHMVYHHQLSSETSCTPRRERHRLCASLWPRVVHTQLVPTMSPRRSRVYKELLRYFRYNLRVRHVRHFLHLCMTCSSSRPRGKTLFMGTGF
jgi:hypothetical protein